MALKRWSDPGLRGSLWGGGGGTGWGSRKRLTFKNQSDKGQSPEMGPGSPCCARQSDGEAMWGLRGVAVSEQKYFTSLRSSWCSER